jgi:hypothetical protein
MVVGYVISFYDAFFHSKVNGRVEASRVGSSSLVQNVDEVQLLSIASFRKERESPLALPLVDH